MQHGLTVVVGYLRIQRYQRLSEKPFSRCTDVRIGTPISARFTYVNKQSANTFHFS
jgi:hypothetical protein